MGFNLMKRKAKTPLILLIVVLAIVASIGVGVLAKYIQQLISADQQADTPEFYLLSDLPENAEDSPYNSTGDIVFKVFNYNAVGTSHMDVDYTVSVYSKDTGEQIPVVVYVDDRYSRRSTLASPSDSQTVYLSGIPNGQCYVIVRSVLFEKELKFYFNVNNERLRTKISYTVSYSYGPAWVVHLMTGEDTSPISIHYPGYSPDNTNVFMEDWLAIDKDDNDSAGQFVGFMPMSHYVLVFFQDDPTAPGSVKLYQNGLELTEPRADWHGDGGDLPNYPAIGFDPNVQNP